MSDSTPDAVQLDITREVCPMTYVRTKLALERLADGGVLEIRLTGAEPLRNVPRSALEEGHEVLGLEALDDGTHRLTLRRRVSPLNRERLRSPTDSPPARSEPARTESPRHEPARDASPQGARKP